MAKKKEEILDQEEADLVSVEMTPEQQKKFVEFMSKEETAEEKPAGPEAIYRMHLVYKHNINGKAYGPGNNVEVPESQVGNIQVAEQRCKEDEIRLNTSSKRMFQVLESGQSIPVRVK